MSLEQISEYDANRWQQLAAVARQRIETRLFIDGQWVDAADGGRFETIDPSNGEVLAAMAAGTGTDIDRAVAAARKAFRTGCWSGMAPRDRMAVRNDVAQQHPNLPLALCRAYSQAKQLIYDFFRRTAWIDISLPWIAQEIKETRETMGENFWPYGIEANRRVLDALFRYSHEQGLAERRLTIDELLHPSTMGYAEG